MKIVKKESGAVLLRDNANNTFHTLYTGNAKVLVGGTGDFVRVFQDQRKKVDIFTADVIAYQIEPAAEIAFAGTTSQLADILAEMLDLEVCCTSGSGGGGDIGANFIELEEIAEPTTPGTDKIRIWTEDVNGISVLKYKDSSGIVLQFMRDNVLVVRNVSGGTLLRGQLVYLFGSTGSRPTVALANASLPGNVPARCILLADVPNNGYVYGMVSGFISGLDTSAFSDGQVLYTSATTPGAITNIAPVSPNFRQTIGVCIRAHPNMGSIEIDFGSIQEQVFTQTKNGLVPAPVLAPSGLVLSDAATWVKNGIIEYNSGSYYPFVKNNSLTTGSIVANTLIGRLMTVEKDVTINEIRLRYSAATPGNAVVGIFNVNSNGIPTSLIVQTGVYTTNLMTVQAQSIAPTLLPRGMYCIAILSDVTNTCNIHTQASLFPNWGYDGSIIGAGSRTTYQAALAYNPTLPGTFPAGSITSNGAAPFLIARIS